MIGYPFGTCLSRNECVTCMHRLSLASTLCLETLMWKSAIGLQAVWQDFYRLENEIYSKTCLKQPLKNRQNKGLTE